MAGHSFDIMARKFDDRFYIFGVQGRATQDKSVMQQ